MHSTHIIENVELRKTSLYDQILLSRQARINDGNGPLVFHEILNVRHEMDTILKPFFLVEGLTPNLWSL